MKPDTSFSNLMDRIYEKYHRREFIGYDPVGFLHFYPEKEDREIAALVAASLAFGRVEQIHRNVKTVLSWMQPGPRVWIESFERSTLEQIHFKHRFVSKEDLLDLIEGIQIVIHRWGSLENCFKKAWEKSDNDILKAVAIFRLSLMQNGGFRCQMLLPDPGHKSPCKRWMLFLRWMVRHDEIDPGGWESFMSPEDLVVPVDVHMQKIARRLGFSLRRSVDWRMAIEITEALKTFDPCDPVKYDFSLTRWSMDGFPEPENETRATGDSKIQATYF
ncbi:MAG: TIGR02757 family protein [Thermodesulforhabdaceae bacterium]